MNLPEIASTEEMAIDIVVEVVNKAQFKLGNKQNLFQLANSRNIFGEAKINCDSLRPPLAITSEDLIMDAIEHQWKLTDTFMYVLEFLETSQDELAHYYYYEAGTAPPPVTYQLLPDMISQYFWEDNCAVFSQPTAEYPVPQATVSVFFRVEDKHIYTLGQKKVPMMWFRIEGHHAEHDVRYVKLTADWLLAVLKMKIKFFKRIEELNIF